MVSSLLVEFQVARICKRMQQSVTTSSDSELVTRIQQDDATAESELYKKYSARIFFLALSELHSKEDAEDIRAETFLRVIQVLRQDKLRNPAALASFIVGIALNVIREHLRQRYKTESLDEVEQTLIGEGSLEKAFLDLETNQAIAQATSQLKPREREFLRLYYYEEMPKEEIAQTLGIKEERLRLIKSRALASFREIYKKLMKH
jgi:RNA polymerase sigma factor (sigma-70 family)